jgi:3-phenylpropionate/trans-cinnamate dioxygenase ferredoxin reductase subunit
MPGAVIVGAGQAGVRVAMALREAGYAKSIRLIGDEGELSCERPALSEKIPIGEDRRESARICAGARYADQDIELLIAVTAVALAPSARRVFLSDGNAAPFEKLLIATGSRVRLLPGAPEGLAGVFYLRTAADSLALRAALAPGSGLVVIGGAYPGLELGASAVAGRCRVTLAEREAHLLVRVMPHPVADAIEVVHRRVGVDVRVGTALARLEGERRVSKVVLAEGAELPADAVATTIGANPNAQLAECAGAQAHDGIVVAEFGRTPLANVYAASDGASGPCGYAGRQIRLEFWHNAQDHAIAGARNTVVGEPVAYDELPWFRSDQYDLNIQMFGIAARGAEIVWRGEAAAPRALALATEGDRITLAGRLQRGSRSASGAAPDRTRRCGRAGRAARPLAADGGSGKGPCRRNGGGTGRSRRRVVSEDIPCTVCKPSSIPSAPCRRRPRRST